MSMSDEKESLFSLEVAVKTIFLKHAIVCRVPKVSVKMLEYPPLELNMFTDDEFIKIKDIIEKEPETVAHSPQILQLQHSTGTYVFTQGKSMLIKEKLSHLEERLLNVPVYVMVVDILPTIPKLVASFALSLEGSIRKIVQSVSLNGIENPCAHGERDVFALYNLMGSKVGEAEMGVRLSSLGVNMLHHVSDITKPQAHHTVPFPMNTEAPDQVQKKSDPSNDPKDLKFEQSVNCIGDKDEENKENMAKNKMLMKSGSTQTIFPKMQSKSVQYPIFQSEVMLANENVYCPPALYYDKRSEALEKDLCLKQHNVNAEVQHQNAQSITLADLQTNSTRKILPSSNETGTKFTLSRLQRQTKNDISEGENPSPNNAASALADFPILKALVEEVTRLGCKEVGQPSTSKQKNQMKIVEDKRKTPKRVGKPKVTALHKSSTKVFESKGPLRFGLTNTMRLRMAMNKNRDTGTGTQNVAKPRQAHSRGSLRSSSKSTSGALGRTFTVKTPRTPMVSTACGPDGSMYRRVPVKPQTVYMGKMGGYEEGTDHDVPSIDHATPEVSDDFIEDLMIVKELATPRAHSRQSQRSIEIHLPTASTEFTIGKDDDPDWASTFSDKERLFEKHRNKAASDEDDPELDTPPESAPASRPGSVTHVSKKVVTISQSLEKSELGSDMYKYSDDFEDDKTWSANRTPSAVTPVASSLVVNEDDELNQDSLDNNAAWKTGLSNIDNSNSKFAHKSSDDAATSSESGRSVVTARTTNSLNGKKRTLKYGTKTAPEPIQCGSPVTQSIDTESGHRGFPDPSKISLTGVQPKKSETTTSKEDKLPKASAGNQDMTHEWDTPPRKPSRYTPPLKPSRFTPSPPTSRRSPMSSPESSRDKVRRMFHHPGRRHRQASSESYSSDFEKPVSPVRRSDSVSSYIPSDLSEISNIRMSEDLSDILSEDTGDSQDESRSVKKRNYMPKDGPKTYFGMPKLDPSNKLAYTK